MICNAIYYSIGIVPRYLLIIGNDQGSVKRFTSVMQYNPSLYAFFSAISFSKVTVFDVVGLEWVLSNASMTSSIQLSSLRSLKATFGPFYDPLSETSDPIFRLLSV